MVMIMKINEKILKYRENHPKCKYCKYYTVEGRWDIVIFNYCIAKDKIINSIEIFRPFCSCYEVKDEL